MEFTKSKSRSPRRRKINHDRLFNNANKLEYNYEKLWENEQSVVGFGSMNLILISDFHVEHEYFCFSGVLKGEGRQRQVMKFQRRHTIICCNLHVPTFTMLLVIFLMSQFTSHLKRSERNEIFMYMTCSCHSVKGCHL